MLLRVAVFGLLLLGLGGFGTVAWISLHPADAPSTMMVTDASFTPVVVVMHGVLASAGPLRAGTLLKPEDVTAKQVLAVPPGAQEDTPANRAGLTGAMVRHSIGPSEVLLAEDVMRPGEHGFLAAVLGPNMRAASIAVDATSGSAGLIWPGDHVDLILTQQLEDSTLPPARRVAAETVLSDVRVIAIDQLLARGVAPPTEGAGISRTVTLEVTIAQAERIAVATRLGRLALSVRSADSTDAPSASEVSVQTTWGGDVSPALGRPAPTAKDGGATLRLFSGGTDGKEFRF